MCAYASMLESVYFMYTSIFLCMYLYVCVPVSTLGITSLQCSVCNAMDCNAVKYTVVQCNVVECSLMQCNAGNVREGQETKLT